MNLFWNPGTVDVVAAISLISAAVALMVSAFRRVYRQGGPSDTKSASEYWGRFGSAALAIIAIYLTYAVFRNQAKQAEEAALNQRAATILLMESSDQNIRCLYEWRGFDAPENCLQKNLDKDQWSKTQLYIEETINFFWEARVDGQHYGANNFHGMTEWADDISKDPTGLFSYYLVENYTIDPQDLATSLGFTIFDMQSKHDKVAALLLSTSSSTEVDQKND